MQVCSKTLKPAHRLWIAIRSHSDVMHAVPNIDPRCLRMDYFQPRIFRLQSPPPFFSLLPVPPQFFLCHDSRSSLEDWDPVRPGDDRLKNLSNGVKGPQHRQPLPPCQRSPVPEPCFYAGARHHSEVGLSSPKRIRDYIFRIFKTRDKFLAPVTAAQARSTAFIGLLSRNFFT